VGVSVGVAVGVSVGVAVGVSVGVTVGVSVGVAVGVSVGVAVGVSVGVAVGVSVGVAVGVSVGVTVGVSVGVTVGVSVGVTVGVAVPVSVGVGVIPARAGDAISDVRAIVTMISARSLDRSMVSLLFAHSARGRKRGILGVREDSSGSILPHCNGSEGKIRNSLEITCSVMTPLRVCDGLAPAA